jgi:outer membrane protein assembly factor BamB
VLWYAGAGGSTSDQGLGITTDVSGNVFLTGYYTGTATFGSLQLVAPDALAHPFLAQYDAGGQPLWAKTIYGTVCMGLVSDGSGNLYLTGDDNLTQQRFVAKYDNSGNSIWVKTAGGKTFYASDINIDPQGNVYFCDDNTILAKFDNSGTLLWKVVNDYPDNFAMLTADKYGNIYVSGDIDGGTVPLGDHTASGPHYLAKLSPFPASVPVLFNGIDMTLYPNPSTGLLQVNGIDFIGYTVTDMTGRQILFDHKAKNTDAIDVSSLPAGNYLLHLQTAGKSTRLKFTKQ